MDAVKKRRAESRAENPISSKPKLVKPNSAGNSEFSGQQESTNVVEAECTQSNSPPGFPYFINILRKRNITGYPLYLPVPRKFVDRNMSDQGKSVVLIDNNNEEFTVSFRHTLPGFGTSWKIFVDAHNLEENDVLKFVLIEPGKFKVSISRARRDVSVNPTNPSARRDVGVTPTNLSLDSSDSTSEDSEQGELSDNPDTDLSEDLRTYKAFQLKSGSLFSQAGLNENTIKKYYELCRSKKEILHGQIQSDYNIKLVAGVISALLNIVDDLKSSNACTTRETLEKWRVALDSFEKLGMKVGCVLKKVNNLITLSSEFEVTRYKVEMRKLEMKRAEFTEAVNKVNEEIEVLKLKAVAHKDKVQEVVNSPWAD